MGQARVLATTEMTHCRVKSTIHMLNQPPLFLNVANFTSDAFTEWSCYCGYQRCSPHTMLTNRPYQAQHELVQQRLSHQCSSTFLSRMASEVTLVHLSFSRGGSRYPRLLVIMCPPILSLLHLCNAMIIFSLAV